MDVKGKKVLIIGLARSGVAAAKLLLKNGAVVRVTEKSGAPSVMEEAQRLKASGAAVETGAHTREFASGVDFIVISPGVSDKCPVIKWAREESVPIISEIELASRFAKVPIIAVTGTNGKTTTTSLIAHILNENKMDAAACGNIGHPLSSVAAETKGLKYAVCEVSSFQLERIVNFKPFVSVFLNLTPDHLDRYPSMDEYRDAKLRIFMNQDGGDWAVVNENCAPFLDGILKKRNINTAYFNKDKSRFTNVFMEDGKLVLSLRGNKEVVCGRDEVKLPGDHNLENIFSAIAAAAVCGASTKGIGAALKSFKAVPHRLEFAGSVNGVNFVNDSKGTNVDSVVVALKAFEGKIILIAGGRDKGGDYAPLKELVREKVRELIVIGEAADKISQQLNGASKITKAESLEDAVRMGLKSASRGDTVLLSPACASFDMFKNYEHRGDEFKRIVQGLIICSEKGS